MLLVITCWEHVEITVWMYPKCNWWIHWEKNDPEPTIYPRYSHWFPGHLTPSVNGKSTWVELRECVLKLVQRELWKQWKNCLEQNRRSSILLLMSVVVRFNNR